MNQSRDKDHEQRITTGLILVLKTNVLIKLILLIKGMKCARRKGLNKVLRNRVKVTNKHHRRKANEKKHKKKIERVWE